MTVERLAAMVSGALIGGGLAAIFVTPAIGLITAGVYVGALTWWRSR